MNGQATLAAGMLIALAACTNREVTNAMKPTDPWSGKYSHHTEIQGADDGTDDYELVVRKSGDHYDIAYTHSSMRTATYKGRGSETNTGELKVIFAGFESNLNYLKNFRPGDHMFTLQHVKVRGTRRGMRLDWEMVPGDDLRKSSVTLYREEPAPNQ